MSPGSLGLVGGATALVAAFFVADIAVGTVQYQDTKKRSDDLKKKMDSLHENAQCDKAVTAANAECYKTPEEMEALLRPVCDHVTTFQHLGRDEVATTDFRTDRIRTRPHVDDDCLHAHQG